MGFFMVYCDVEPKRKALAAANAELATAQEKLSKIKAKIKVCAHIEIMVLCFWRHVKYACTHESGLSVQMIIRWLDYN